ncbi:hypothetical protein [Paenibacillus validus]
MDWHLKMKLYLEQQKTNYSKQEKKFSKLAGEKAHVPSNDTVA